MSKSIHQSDYFFPRYALVEPMPLLTYFCIIRRRFYLFIATSQLMQLHGEVKMYKLHKFMIDVCPKSVITQFIVFNFNKNKMETKY